MDWGEGDENKFVFGVRLAAALGSIALAAGDPMRFDVLAGRRTGTASDKAPGTASASGTSFGPSRGSHQTLRYLHHLATLSPGGQTALETDLARFALSRSRPGLALLISDLLDPAGYQNSLDRILGQGHQVVVIHLLAPDELEPQLAGDLKLIDREFGTSQEVSLDAGVLAGYKRQLDTWLDGLETYCRGRGVGYVRTSTGAHWDRFILRQLRAEGVVK
jgi:uncharacterized protein (DUF58 family)